MFASGRIWFSVGLSFVNFWNHYRIELVYASRNSNRNTYIRDCSYCLTVNGRHLQRHRVAFVPGVWRCPESILTVSRLSILVEASGGSERCPEILFSQRNHAKITTHITLVEGSLSGGLMISTGFSADLFGSDDAYFLV